MALQLASQITTEGGESEEVPMCNADCETCRLVRNDYYTDCCLQIRLSPEGLSPKLGESDCGCTTRPAPRAGELQPHEARDHASRWPARREYRQPRLKGNRNIYYCAE